MEAGREVEGGELAVGGKRGKGRFGVRSERFLNFDRPQTSSRLGLSPRTLNR
jgi:hypothetical protein